MLALQIERKVWKKESNFSLIGNYSMQFLNDHMGEPRVDGHFNIPGLPQGITVKAMNINLSNETTSLYQKSFQCCQPFVIHFFETK